MSNETIIYEEMDGIVTITMNRPQKLNALSDVMIAELTEAFHKADEDPTVAAVILTGAGEKSFCAGGDVSSLSGLTGDKAKVWNKRIVALSTAIRNMYKPVIAAVNGICIGAGNELNCFCDVTIASSHAKFGQAGPLIGATPIWGGSQLLPRIVGEKKAREMMYFCWQYSAEEAERMGLVNKVVAPEELQAEAQRWARRILDMSPQSIRIAKVSLNFESDLLYPSYTHSSEMLNFIWGSEEAVEGMQAFKEKRPADFKRFRTR
jgi:dihydroxynaphthoic acid synthetase